MMEAIILAGGLGTRLREVVPDRPKPMAPVAGKPFLEWLLKALAGGGIQRIILSVGYRADQIIRYFGRRFENMPIEYSIEQEPLGTGGAIYQAWELVRGSLCFVLNGDTFFKVDYPLMKQRFGVLQANLLLALKSVPDTARYGRVVVKNDTVIRFEEKGPSGPGLINGGVYLVDRDLFAAPPPARCFSLERDFLQPRIAQLKPKAFIATGFFIDIGLPEDYELAQRELVSAGGFKGLTK